MASPIIASAMSLAIPTRVAITVDDLPVHGKLPSGVSRTDITKKFLKILKEEKIPEAYGFINAKKLEDDPSLFEDLKLWTGAGHPLGNHSYSHPSLSTTSEEDFKNDIEKNEETLRKLSGKMDWHYFRYPFLREGDTFEKRDAIRGFLKERGYKIAQVTIDFEDWSWNDPYARCAGKKDKVSIQWLRDTYLKNATDQLDRAEVMSKALFSRPIPHILLLHIGGFDAEMFRELIQAYKKKGVQFITLSEAMKDEIYTIDPKIVGKYGRELTYQVMKMRGLKLADLGLNSYEDFPEKKLKELCR